MNVEAMVAEFAKMYNLDDLGYLRDAIDAIARSDEYSARDKISLITGVMDYSEMLLSDDVAAMDKNAGFE
jgi:hypothetical protein